MQLAPRPREASIELLRDVFDAPEDEVHRAAALDAGLALPNQLSQMHVLHQLDNA
jgi:hypothetical protein